MSEIGSYLVRVSTRRTSSLLIKTDSKVRPKSGSLVMNQRSRMQKHGFIEAEKYETFADDFARGPGFLKKFAYNSKNFFQECSGLSGKFLVIF